MAPTSRTTGGRGHAAWINDILLSDLRLAGGALHHGVGSGVEIGVRVGPLTAYPHPNQPYFNRIGPGMALQVAGGASIGGYGGENYRAFILADAAGGFDPHMRKLWEVSKRTCDMQVELSAEGVTCSRGVRHPQAPGGRACEARLPPSGPRRGVEAPAALPALGDHTTAPQRVPRARPLTRARLRLQLERHRRGGPAVGLPHEPGALQQGVVLAEALIFILS
jgi:hypothetical protein